MIKNIIKLNIPAYPGGPLPRPEEPIFTLNGQPIEHLVSVKLDVDGARQALTVVTLRIYAQVDGEFIIEEKQIG